MRPETPWSGWTRHCSSNRCVHCSIFTIAPVARVQQEPLECIGGPARRRGVRCHDPWGLTPGNCSWPPARPRMIDLGRPLIAAGTSQPDARSRARKAISPEVICACALPCRRTLCLHLLCERAMPLAPGEYTAKTTCNDGPARLPGTPVGTGAS